MARFRRAAGCRVQNELGFFIILVMERKALIISVLTICGIFIYSGSVLAGEMELIQDNSTSKINAAGEDGGVVDHIAMMNCVYNYDPDNENLNPEDSDLESLPPGKHLPTCDDGDKECETKVLRVIDIDQK